MALNATEIQKKAGIKGKLSKSEKELLASIYENYHVKVRNFIYSKAGKDIRNNDLIEDIVNRVFFTLFKKRNTVSIKKFKYHYPYYCIGSIGFILRHQKEYKVSKKDKRIPNFYERVKYVLEKGEGQFDEDEAKNIVRIEEIIKKGRYYAGTNILDLPAARIRDKHGSETLNSNEDDVISYFKQTNSNPETENISKEFRSHLHKAFAECLDKRDNKRDKFIFIRHFYEGQTNVSIGRDLAITGAAVGQRISKMIGFLTKCVKNKLRKLYDYDILEEVLLGGSL